MNMSDIPSMTSIEENDPWIKISQTKALIAAAFIQYLFYGVLYILEGVKLKDYEDDI